MKQDDAEAPRAAATTMTLTVVHPVEFDLRTMTLAEIEAMTDLGQFAASRDAPSTRTLSRDEEDAALADVGAEPGFLDPSTTERR